MSGSIGLVQGKQTQAANLIIDRLPTIDQAIRGIADTVSAESAGFAGNAAAGLTTALADWLTSASELPQILAQYAAALAEVDRTAAAADAKGATVLGAAPSGSGLNME